MCSRHLSIQIPALPVGDVPTQIKNLNGNEFIACVDSNIQDSSNDSDENSLTRAVDAIDFLDTIELIDEQNSDGESVGIDVDKLEEYLL
jgi:hypothetical protein